MSKLPSKSQYSGQPEERRGTKSYRAYTDQLACNYKGRSIALSASRRQEMRAFKLVKEGVRADASVVQGRVIRALMRMTYQDIGEHADSLFYGHP